MKIETFYIQIDRDVFESDAVSDVLRRRLVSVHLKSIATGLGSNFRKALGGGSSKCRMFFIRAGCHYFLAEEDEQWVFKKVPTSDVQQLLVGNSKSAVTVRSED
jgi:hypothetical protein